MLPHATDPATRIGGRARLTLVALTLIVMAGLAACGTDGDEVSEQDNVATADALREEIADLPGVTDVTGNYQDNLTAPGALAITVEVDDTVDRDAMRDTVMGLVWQSTIDPLDRIRLNIGSGPDSGGYTDYSTGRLTEEDTAAFDEQFGERPI